MNDEVEELVRHVREHYVSQLRAFIRQQKAACATGAAEVKFELGDTSRVYRQLIVADFVRNNNEPEFILFEPENVLKFEKFEGIIGATKLVVDSFRWDAVSVHHDLSFADVAIASWFDKWFDPDEVNFDPSAEISSCIHEVCVEPNALQIDLGSAPMEALMELLESLASSNATFVHVR